MRQLLASLLTVTAIAFASYNCVAQNPPGMAYDIIVDTSGLSQTQISTIEAAADQWMFAENMTLRISFERQPYVCSTDSDYTVCISGQPSSFFREGMSRCGVDTVGCTAINKMTQSSELVLDTDVAAGDFQEVVTHELGHAFGLLHIKQRSVMYWEVNGIKYLTCDDLQQFENIRGDSSRNCYPHWELDLQHP